MSIPAPISQAIGGKMAPLDAGYPAVPNSNTHDGSMVLLYMVTWIPSIYPSHVSIYTSTMDPSWDISTLISTTSPMNWHLLPS